MHLPVKLKTQLIYLFWAFLDAFALASALTLAIARRYGSNIFYIQSVPELNMPLLVISTAVLTAGFFGLFNVKKRLYRYLTPLCVTVFGVTVNLVSSVARPYFALAICCVAVAAALTVKDKFSDKLPELLKGGNLYFLILTLTVIMAAQVAFVGITRHRCYSSSTFDLGIFAQMYHFMSVDFTQNTTIERNVLLSHFAVHFSPVYYLLLPFYMIFPSVECLLAAQAAICFSGVIPLLLLCKRWRYGGKATLGISLAFLLYPAFSGGLLYDFHENAFLVPLLLWLLYFVESNNTVGIAVSALLTLCVKEDAGIYVVFIGMYALFSKRVKRVNSVMLLIAGASGFIAVTSLVEAIGEGIKVSRYQIYLNAGQDSLTDVVMNVIRNPAFFFSRLLNETKLLFLVQMLVPLLFLPVKTRKLSDWMLFAPMVLVNLASDYAYQADLNFQYVFGSGVLMVFLFAKNIRYVKGKAKLAATAAMAAAIILSGVVTEKYESIERFYLNYESITATDQTLAEIPRDAVIFSTTYFTPHLADCENLYMYPFVYSADKDIVPDYVVLDNRGGVVKEYSELVNYWQEQGYTVISKEGYATVLVSS